MFKTTKKILGYTAITSILNLSFQPAYAGKSDFPLVSEEMSYTQKVSHHLSKKDLYTEKLSDPGLKDLQANSTRTSQMIEADTVSMFFLTPLKTMMGAVSFVKQGVRFALENPGKAITMGLLLQARTVTSTLNLSALTPNQGFNINGASAGDQSGFSVSSAGDFNGDGLNDLIIGAYGANRGAGASYVIYGTNSTPSSLSLSSLTQLQGFNISGAVPYDWSGYSVSSAGDFNDDGLNDLIIGAPYANSDAGNSYVIYGTKTPPSSLNLSSLTQLQGFNIIGTAKSGWSVSSAGDFNGDGLNDVIIGAIGERGNGNSYVIYGTKTPPSPLNLSSLTQLQGFTIYGSGFSGRSVSSAGDFNGDGLNDVIIGAYMAGSSYIIYGTNSTPSSLSLTSLTPLQGFTITGVYGDNSGRSVSSAGDFNGDGLGDVIIGAPLAGYLDSQFAGASYVIYGTKTPPSPLRIGYLTAEQGFAITGAAAGDQSGDSVSSAGDFNGDGLNDLIIGAPFANNATGKTYVIYGTNSKPRSISLSSLTPNQGFNISGAITGDKSGWSVSSAGDFNGDGLNDLIIGAPFANNATGKTYVIYGIESTGSTESSASGGSGSSGTSGKTSWKTFAAIGGGIGGAVVAGVIGGIIVKKCCFSNRNKSGYSRLKPIEEDA